MSTLTPLLYRNNGYYDSENDRSKDNIKKLARNFINYAKGLYNRFVAKIQATGNLEKERIANSNGTLIREYIDNLNKKRSDLLNSLDYYLNEVRCLIQEHLKKQLQTEVQNQDDYKWFSLNKASFTSDKEKS